MTLIGYTLMWERADPKRLVRDVTLAEQAGFDSRPVTNKVKGSAARGGPDTDVLRDLTVR